MKYLVTGTAGFIGFHLARRLLEEGHQVVGIDNINDYYDVNLKLARLKETGITGEINEHQPIISSRYPKYTFIKMDLADRQAMEKLFCENQFDQVCHLAAQAGVRYSLENPHVYIESNIVGFLHILEGCRQSKIKNLVYASSSSVYGLNSKIPYCEEDRTDNPASLYAATKKSNELMAHTYSHLYGINTIGLRFFTVYGPWGRPDMAPWKFTKAISEGKTIDVYNHGDMERDFTYIDDIVEGVYLTLRKQYSDLKNENFRILNIGRNEPVNLMEFIKEIEKHIGKEARINMMPIQPGDVQKTWAKTSILESYINFIPTTSITVGTSHFTHWFSQRF